MAILPELSADEKKFFETKGESGVPEPKTEQEQKAAPEPVAPKVPEPVKEPEPEVEDTGGDPKIALKIERDKRRAIQKERDDLKNNYTKLESRLDTLNELAQSVARPQQQVQEPQIPDINTDPVGHFRVRNELNEKRLAELDKKLQTQDTRFNEQLNVQGLQRLLLTREQNFRTQKPDYDAATDHLKTARANSLRAIGFTDDQIAQAIANDVFQVTTQALNAGRDPAQAFYDMSVAYGYRAAESKKPDAVTPSPTVAPSEAEKVRMAAAGQKAGASIGQMSGGATPPTTLESIAQMSDEEFDQYYSQKKRELRKNLGA